MIRLTRVAGIALALLIVSACQKQQAGSAPDADAAQAAPGKAAVARDWTTIVAVTPEGGFRMGNPAAPVKLVEFGSLTCSHCAAFAAEGIPALKANYVKSGKVSFEFRNFVRDPIDFSAALLTRCAGSGPFFKLTDQVFAGQAAMFEKLQKMTDADQKRIGALPPEQQFGALAKAAGLDSFMAARGIPSAKANACLTDKKASDALLAIRKDATDHYNLTGTPTFVINGEVVPNTAAWEALEPAIKAKIG